MLVLRPGMGSGEIAAGMGGTLVEVFGPDWQQRWRLEVSRSRCFLALRAAPTQGTLFEDRLGWTGAFEVAIAQTLHVPAKRSPPGRTYPTAALSGGLPGVFTDYAAAVLHHWQVTGDPRLNRLAGVLERLGLTWTAEARQVSDAEIELMVGRVSTSAKASPRDLVNVVDAGSGVSQVLPVLVALLAAEPGQLVYLAEPEMDLHPGAMEGLALALADAAMRGARVVAETHSSLLLLAIQSLVREGKLPYELVCLNWFTRRRDGSSRIQAGRLDQSGRFGDWPEDFGDIELGAQRRYLDAAWSAGMSD